MPEISTFSSEPHNALTKHDIPRGAYLFVVIQISNHRFCPGAGHPITIKGKDVIPETHYRVTWPTLPYFFFASLPIGIGTGAEKVTKRKASFGQRLRRPKHSSTLLLWGKSIWPRSTCGRIGQQYCY